MAISVSDALKEAWKNKYGQPIQVRVQYKRRYYDSSSPAQMRWEDSWRTFGDPPISIQPIPQQLDTPFMNIFRTTEFSLKMDNTDNQWIATSEIPSIFAADDTTPEGYYPYLTKIRVQAGYKLASGSFEWVTRFTGVIKTIRLTGKGAAADITVASMAHLLEVSDAEDVSETFTEEATVPATGDGSNPDFETQTEGVDHLDLVEVAPSGSPLVYAEVPQGGWEVAGIAESGPATISFGADYIPEAGDAVRSSGRNWLANQEVGYLVDLLFVNAGFAESEYTIDPVIFAGGLSGSQTIDTEEDWSGATVDACSYEALSGYLHLGENITNGGFETGDFTNWSTSTDAGFTLNVVDSEFDAAEGSCFASFYGGKSWAATWTAKAQCGTAELDLDLGASGVWRDGELDVEESALGNVLRFSLQASDATQASLACDQYIHYAQKIRFKYVFASIPTVPPNSAAGLLIDDVRAVVVTAEGSFEIVLDLLAAPTAFGVLQIWQELNGGTTTITTAGADAEGGPFGDLVELVDNVPQSELKRFLKVRGDLASAGNLGPVIDKFKVNFTVTDIPIALANHAEKNGLMAVEAYAKLCDYEFGFKADGTGYFRSKDPVGSYTVELTQENAIVDIIEYDPGWDRVINCAKARYNGYYTQYDKDDAGEAEPTSERIYGRRVYTDDLTGTLLANDVDLAASRAQAIYERNCQPRRRLTLRVWDIPWLELGDVVRINYFDHPLLKQYIAGDPMQRADRYFTPGGEALNVLARDLDMKVIGWTPDIIDPGQSILVVEEIFA